jgi:hypothetical protein
MEKKFSLGEFQSLVDDVLIRHKSILDILSKVQESSARVNRAVAKASTSCGCIKICAEKPQVPEDVTFSKLKSYMSDHVEGKLCSTCEEKIKQEISNNLFYLFALCNTFDLDTEKMTEDYYKQLKLLGKYGLL